MGLTLEMQITRVIQADHNDKGHDAQYQTQRSEKTFDDTPAAKILCEHSGVFSDVAIEQIGEQGEKSEDFEHHKYMSQYDRRCVLITVRDGTQQRNQIDQQSQNVYDDSEHRQDLRENVLGAKAGDRTHPKLFDLVPFVSEDVSSVVLQDGFEMLRAVVACVGIDLDTSFYNRAKGSRIKLFRGNAAGQQIVEQRAAGVNIRPPVGLLKTELLRRGVADRAEDIGIFALFFLDGPDDVVVNDFDRACGGDHNVGGIDIPMDDSMLMENTKTRADRDDDRFGVVFGVDAAGFNSVFQGNAFDVFAQTDALVPDEIRVVDTHQVGMTERSKCPHCL